MSLQRVEGLAAIAAALASHRRRAEKLWRENSGGVAQLSVLATCRGTFEEGR